MELHAKAGRDTFLLVRLFCSEAFSPHRRISAPAGLGQAHVLPAVRDHGKQVCGYFHLYIRIRLRQQAGGGGVDPARSLEFYHRERPEGSDSEL